MTCIVFGASGLIGGHLLQRLVRGGDEVVAVSRRPRASVDAVEWLHGALPDAVPILPADICAIVCLGPLDHFSHWFERADISGQPAVVAMSSMSAQSKRHSPVVAERELAARLRASEQRLLARCEALGSVCTILRATLIHGGATGSLEKLAARARRWHVFPLLKGRGLRQPVHADDLAQAVLAALGQEQSPGVLGAGGGERLDASAMFARVHERLAGEVPGLPVPGLVLRALAGVSGKGRGMAKRLDQDLVADNTKLVDLLGVRPRGFMPEREQGGV